MGHGRKTRASYEKVAYRLAHADPAATPGSATSAQLSLQVFVIVRLTKLARLLLKDRHCPRPLSLSLSSLRFLSYRLPNALPLLDCPGRTPTDTECWAALRVAPLRKYASRTPFAFLDLPSGTALNASANSFFFLIFFFPSLPSRSLDVDLAGRSGRACSWRLPRRKPQLAPRRFCRSTSRSLFSRLRWRRGSSYRDGARIPSGDRVRARSRTLGDARVPAGRPGRRARRPGSSLGSSAPVSAPGPAGAAVRAARCAVARRADGCWERHRRDRRARRARLARREGRPQAGRSHRRHRRREDHRARTGDACGRPPQGRGHGDGRVRASRHCDDRDGRAGPASVGRRHPQDGPRRCARLRPGRKWLRSAVRLRRSRSCVVASCSSTSGLRGAARAACSRRA